MLLLTDFRAFADAFVNERPNLENNITVAEHDDAVNEYKDIVNAGNTCTLITLVPSHDDDSNNEDNAKMKNNLSFYILKKTDTKASNDTKLDNFAICQLEILALAKKIKALISNPEGNCMFKNIELNSIQITPMPNYLGGNGYVMDFYTKTAF
ncbi:hypothetical protein [Thalassobellus citreus]|uniref:hypothetical protein n=1 Tax=Thalassobellus citreus TaxID=3367752 RepID=UPI0037B51348